MREFWNGEKWFAGTALSFDGGLHDGGLQGWGIDAEERCELSDAKLVVLSVSCSLRACSAADDFGFSQRVFSDGRRGNRKVARMFFVVKQPFQRTPPLDACSSRILMVSLPEMASLWQVWRECAVSY